MNFDELLTQDAHEEGAEVQIVNPNTGQKTDVFIKVLGPDSRAFRVAMKSAIRKLISKSSDEDEVQNEIEQIASVTIGWRGITKDGKELEFTKKACKQLYAKSPRVLDQVNRFIGDYKNKPFLDINYWLKSFDIFSVESIRFNKKKAGQMFD